MKPKIKFEGRSENGMYVATTLIGTFLQKEGSVNEAYERAIQYPPVSWRIIPDERKEV